MLTERDRQVLDFEGCRWQLEIPKQAGIRTHLDMSVTRYSQILRRLIDEPDALVYAPLVTRRLRRVRAEQSEQSRVSSGSGRLQ